MAKATGEPTLLNDDPLNWDRDDINMGVTVMTTTFLSWLAIVGPIPAAKDMSQEEYNQGIALSWGLTVILTGTFSIVLETWLPMIFAVFAGALLQGLYEWVRRGEIK